MASESKPLLNRAVSNPRPGLGLLAVFACNVIWGLLPLYWRAMKQGEVPVEQIVAQRLVWSCIVVLFLLCLTRQLGTVRALLKKPKQLLLLALGSAMTTTGWLIYITLVNSERVLQASLSTYLSPLVLMSMGVVIFKDRLTTLKWLAVFFAVAGVACQVAIIGTLPWAVLAMVLVSACYRLLRTVMPVDAMPGLFIENLLACPFAIGIMLWWHSRGTLVFLRGDVTTDLLILGTGVITAFPLMWSVFGVRNAPFTSVGLVNFIAPSMIFIMGVFVFKETFTFTHFISFFLIWVALALYSAESFRQHKIKSKKQEPVPPVPAPRAY